MKEIKLSFVEISWGLFWFIIQVMLVILVGVRMLNYLDPVFTSIGLILASIIYIGYKIHLMKYNLMVEAYELKIGDIKKEAEGIMESLNNQVTNKSESNKDLENRLLYFKDKVTSLKDEVSLKENRVTSLKKEVTSKSEEFEIKLLELEERIKESYLSNKTSNDTLQRVTSENNSLKLKYNKLREESKEWERAYNSQLISNYKKSAKMLIKNGNKEKALSEIEKIVNLSGDLDKQLIDFYEKNS